MEDKTVDFMHVVGTELKEGETTNTTIGGYHRVEAIDEKLDQELRQQAEPLSPPTEEDIKDAQQAIDTISQEEFKAQLEAMLVNPQIRENVLANAKDFKKRCKGWFTIEQLARKLMLDPKPVYDMLEVMILFQMAYRKEHKGQWRYKIQLSDQDKLSILQEELEEAEQRVAYLKSRISEISNKSA